MTLWTILPLLNASHAFVSLGWNAGFGFEHEKNLSCTIREFEEYHPHIKVNLISHVPIGKKLKKDKKKKKIKKKKKKKKKKGANREK